MSPDRQALADLSIDVRKQLRPDSLLTKLRINNHLHCIRRNGCQAQVTVVLNNRKVSMPERVVVKPSDESLAERLHAVGGVGVLQQRTGDGGVYVKQFGYVHTPHPIHSSEFNTSPMSSEPKAMGY